MTTDASLTGLWVVFIGSTEQYEKSLKHFLAMWLGHMYTNRGGTHSVTQPSLESVAQHTLTVVAGDMCPWCVEQQADLLFSTTSGGSTLSDFGRVSVDLFGLHKNT